MSYDTLSQALEAFAVLQAVLTTTTVYLSFDATKLTKQFMSARAALRGHPADRTVRNAEAGCARLASWGREAGVVLQQR